MANYNGPWGIRFNPFLVAQSGKPFNVTLPTDPLNNFAISGRPSRSCQCCHEPIRTLFPRLLSAASTASLPRRATHSRQLGQRSGGGGRQSAHQPRIWLRPQTRIGNRSGRRRATPGGGPHGGGGGRRGGPPGGGLGPGGLGGGGGRGGPGGMFGERHRPQVLAELQRAGAESLQQHRLRNAQRNCDRRRTSTNPQPLPAASSAPVRRRAASLRKLVFSF